MLERNLCSQSTRISLVSLVMSIISLISCKKRNYTLYFWGGVFRRVVVFGGMGTFRDLLTPVKFYGYFRRVFTFGTLRFIRQFRNERKLGRVHFRKDVWDSYQGRKKNWPIADRRVSSNYPRNNCGTHFGSLLVSKVVNGHSVLEFVWRRSVYLIIGRFPFYQNVGFEFSTTSSSEWNSIFQNFR